MCHYFGWLGTVALLAVGCMKECLGSPHKLRHQAFWSWGGSAGSTGFLLTYSQPYYQHPDWEKEIFGIPGKEVGDPGVKGRGPGGAEEEESLGRGGAGRGH